MKKILRSLLVICALDVSGFVLNACSSDIEFPESDAGNPPAADAGNPQQDASTPPADSGSTVTCGPQLVLCGGQCTNLTNDSNNCGGCGLTCGAGTSCVNSVCAAPPTDAGTPPADSGACTSGLTSCSGTCCDLRTDVRNCGACGRTCGVGQTCNAGTCTNPPVTDAGTPPPSTDEWRLVYRTASGAAANAIQSAEFWDGGARECNLNYLDPEQRGAALTSTERCPTMRFARGAELRFNARFTLPATPATAPMPLETWSCHIAVRGGPMQSYGTVEAYRNGVRVTLRMVDNERGGCNWAPVE